MTNPVASPNTDSISLRTDPSINPNIGQTDASSRQAVSRHFADTGDTRTIAADNRSTDIVRDKAEKAEKISPEARIETGSSSGNTVLDSRLSNAVMKHGQTNV
jgi:hypothetical protein